MIYAMTCPTEDHKGFTTAVQYGAAEEPKLWICGRDGMLAWARYLTQVASTAHQDAAFLAQALHITKLDFKEAGQAMMELRGERGAPELLAPDDCPFEVSYVVNLAGEAIVQIRERADPDQGWQMSVEATMHHVTGCMVAAATAPLDEKLLAFYQDHIGLDEETARRALGGLADYEP